MIFLFMLKMGPKATETTLQIKKAFAQELLMDMWYRDSPATLTGWRVEANKHSIVRDHWKLTITN